MRRFPMFLPALLAALASSGVLAAVRESAERSSPPPSPAASSRPTEAPDSTRRKVTVGLVQGQAIVGTFVEEAIRVQTRYGLLRIPFSEVVKLRTRPSLGEEGEALVAEFVTAVTAEEKDAGRVARAKAEVRKLDISAYGALVRALEEIPEGKPGHDEIQKLVDAFESREGTWLMDFDEIVTERFTVRGHILESEAHLECLASTIRIPWRDVVHVTYRELDIRRTFKVGASHAERSGLLDTGFKVRKGQKISLTPSGTMTYNGQTYGPAGISNHTWNSRKMGCLQWRIGAAGPWKVLGTPFEGKADATGPLQFCVHLIGSGGSGDFKIVLVTKAK